MKNAAGLAWIGDGRVLFSEVMAGGIVAAPDSFNGVLLV